MDFESILNTIQPFVIMFAALIAAFLTAIWISAVIWTFRDIRARSRDVFAQILATLMVLLFFPLFPLPGLLLYWILRPRETLSEIYERSLEEEALLQGIEERLACPGCNRRIEETFLVCPTCHTRLKKRCPACGNLLHLRWNICPYCGSVQTAAKPAVAPPPVVMQVEPPADAAMQANAAAASSLPEPMVEAEVEAIPPDEMEFDNGVESFFPDDMDMDSGVGTIPPDDMDMDSGVGAIPSDEMDTGADIDSTLSVETSPEPDPLMPDWEEEVEPEQERKDTLPFDFE